MKKNYLIEFGLSLLFVVTSCSNLIQDPRERKLINEGNKIITKIETYRKHFGKIPNYLSEIGIKEIEEGPLYYQKIDSTSYMVWFGTTLGKSKTYYSSQKQWENRE